MASLPPSSSSGPTDLCSPLAGKLKRVAADHCIRTSRPGPCANTFATTSTNS